MGETAMKNKLKGYYNVDFGGFKGNLVLRGFDTENDLRISMDALDRLCVIIAGESLYNINLFLEKYRRISSKEIKDEAGSLE